MKYTLLPSKYKAMTLSTRHKLLSVLLLFGFLTARQGLAETHAWLAVGPDGGDARSFAPDPSNPNHIFLGTTNSWIYETEDGGSSWRRLAKLSKDDDLILDNILVDEADPKTLYVGAWVVDHPDGGLFISHDAGKTWTSVQAMQGQSIRALSQAASNSKLLIAGTLRGVFRSEDGGVQWKQITPVGSLELHEVESIAIDPKNTQTIYAGTWHLPWKTTDGGAAWHNIKEGLIDDSDVFSIIIDPQQTNIVYTSACSGIYKSENGGENYHKIQGIPSTARRTRVLMQDPVNPAVVYAGTTEGLYKTTDSGATWRRMTGSDVIINDVHVDPKNPQHVLLATDRSGVLESSDSAFSFKASNTGFSERHVATLLVDQKTPRTIYAGVINDKTYGGVFVSTDNGEKWTQRSDGLDGRDVFTLAQAADGSVWAGTNEGVFHWDGTTWQPAGKVVKSVTKSSYVVHKGKRTKVDHTQLVPGGEIDGRVRALDLDGGVWSAATSSGVYTSTNQGASWEGGPVLTRTEFLSVASQGSTILAAQRNSLVLSTDGGQNWQALALPEKLSFVQSVAVDPSGTFWVGGRQGIFFSQDHAQSWRSLSTLPVADINGLSYDPELKRLVVTSWRSTWVLAIDPATQTWKWWDAGWSVQSVHSSGGRLLGATLYNGVVIQPPDTTMTAAVNSRQ
jgi:photosystem II stability/assembly factor-like uncharacterized protein